MEEVQCELSKIVSTLQFVHGVATEELESIGKTLPGYLEGCINTNGIAIMALNSLLNSIQATLEEDVK